MQRVIIPHLGMLHDGDEGPGHQPDQQLPVDQLEIVYGAKWEQNRKTINQEV